MISREAPAWRRGVLQDHDHFVLGVKHFFINDGWGWVEVSQAHFDYLWTQETLKGWRRDRERGCAAEQDACKRRDPLSESRF